MLRPFSGFCRALPRNDYLLRVAYGHRAGHRQTTSATQVKERNTTWCKKGAEVGRRGRAFIRLLKHYSLFAYALRPCPTNLCSVLRARVCTFRCHPLADARPPGVWSATVSEGARSCPPPQKYRGSGGVHSSPSIEHRAPSAESAETGTAKETEPPREGGRQPPNNESGGAGKKW